MTVIIDTPIRRNHGFDSYTVDSHPTSDTTIEVKSNEDFLNAVLGEPKRFHYSSRDKLHFVNMPIARTYRDESKIYNGAECEVGTVSLGIQALHQAFSAHECISLRPDTLWYFIVHEVAEYVRQNASKFAYLFTDTPESKKVIHIRDDSLNYNGPSDWQRSINLVRDPLATKVSDRTIDLFLPHFTTSTVEDDTALLVAFMDAASPYYQYQWSTMCGIPQIRLEGASTDWHQLYSRTENLAREFNKGLSNYFADLLPVLQVFAETANGAKPSREFWRSIYKFGGGSGGPYVNGWITAFFAYVQTPEGPVLKKQFDWLRMQGGFGGFKTNQFPSHVTKVPFVWNYYGTEYDMAFVAGVTGVDSSDNFLTPRLGFAVVEV